MQQFFLSDELNIGESIRLPEEIANQLLRVLRMREGDKIRLIDGEGRPYLAEVKPAKKACFATVLERLVELREHPVRIHLRLAKIKKDKWEWTLQKATELGVSAISPLVTEHVNQKDFRDEKKLKLRYQKIMQEAAEQAERHRIPDLLDEARLEDLFPLEGGLSIVCAERTAGETPTLLELLREKGPIREAEILIGPEGGYSQEELESLENRGFQLVSLGPRILRAETAAILAVGLVSQALPE